MRKVTGKARLYRIAAHEAGHAVVSVLSTRALYGNDVGFDRVQIQLDRRKPIITGHGPRRNIVGICEQSNLWNPGFDIKILLGLPFSPKLSRDTWIPAKLSKPARARIANVLGIACARIEWQIRRDLAGGVAERASEGVKAKGYFNGPILGVGMEMDYRRAEEALDDYRILTGRPYGLQRFHQQTRDLVLGAWAAIDALARALTDAGLLEFADAHRIIAPLLTGSAQQVADAP